MLQNEWQMHYELHFENTSSTSVLTEALSKSVQETKHSGLINL